MPELRLRELSQYRLERAEAMLLSARRDSAAGDYASANNRAYYCIFHAMRAVLALDNADFKKHAAVIARFGQEYLKTGRIDRAFGALITTASLIRNRSDYEDFYICSIEETERLLMGANHFLVAVREFLER